MKTNWQKTLFALLLSLMCLTTAYAANMAASGSADQPAQSSAAVQNIIPSPPTIDAKAYILMDANTGVILAGKEIDQRMPPASLTKLMTLYQVAAALKAKRLQLNDMVFVSEKAWRTGGSKMFIKIGDRVSVSDLVQGISVVSGNDACVAIAEQIAGTEEAFCDLMNRSAVVLGLKNTHFTDSTGLPDPNHYTSSRDLALLTKAIVNQFPEYYHWYGQKWFVYNNIKQPNRDLLLWRDPTVEGMKTGHTEEAGYCLVSTASRKGMRLISVVMGSSSSHRRADASLALLNYGFHFYESKKLFAANKPLQESRIWFGNKKMLPLGAAKDVYVTAPIGQLNNMQTTLQVNQKLVAPIQKGQVIGTIQVTHNDKEYLSVPLVALAEDTKGGLFSRLKDHATLLVYKVLHKIA